mmetsp:Transcript_12279/g.26683  ORF Transcript_12279/g.26683 Transcript_12279/m.26683 type:complete len:88 (+) Transcript_12279:101-364(+)
MSRHVYHGSKLGRGICRFCCDLHGALPFFRPTKLSQHHHGFQYPDEIANLVTTNQLWKLEKSCCFFQLDHRLIHLSTRLSPQPTLDE